jgi:hypothetical protein
MLQKFASRIDVVKTLHQNPATLVQEMAALDEASKGLTREERSKWLQERANRQQEVADAVRVKVNTDVLAQMFGLGFLQSVTLGPSDWPVIETDKRDKHYRCTILGEDGNPRKKQRVLRRAHQEYLMRKFSTEEVEYPLMSIQTGDVNEIEKVRAELTYELALLLDQAAIALLWAAKLASGLRATLDLHSSIVAANIPDANYLDLSASDSGELTVTKMKLILAYFDSFASDVELDGAPLAVNTMYMPSSLKRDIWDFVTMVAGYSTGSVVDPKATVPLGVGEGIFRSGKINEMFGNPVNIVTRNTIAAPYIYISTNKPCGFAWGKPSMDRVVINNSAEMENKNLNSMKMHKVGTAVIPEEWTYRFAIVKV